MNHAHRTLAFAFGEILFGLGLALVPLSTAYASTSLAIESLAPSTTVAARTTVSFVVSTNGFSNPTFSISDSASASSISGGDINSSGDFSWTPTTNDVGTHDLTITVNDASGNSAAVTETLTVNSSSGSIAIESLSPSSTIEPGQTVSFTIVPSGFTNPTYSISDSANDSTVSGSDINSSGNFSWTPSESDTGTHDLIITVNDADGHSGTVEEDLTVGASGSASSIVLQADSSSTVGVGQQVLFTVDASGFSDPYYSVNDSVDGSSVSNSDINSSGDFSWTPTASDVGTHTLNVSVSDSEGHVANAALDITITTAGATATELAPTTSSYTFTTYLYPGLESNDVTELQTVLTQHGFYSGPITGYFGDLTEAAVVSFQSAHGLDQLGVVGPATRAAFNELIGSTGTAAPSTSVGDGYVFNDFLGEGMTSDEVTELQNRLTALGVYSGPITGYFGDLTAAAVATFQGAHDIEQVGYVGPATRAALNQ